MGKWSRNVEDYADITAGIAIGRVSREERKIAMAKKRNCRRTTDENIIHEKAVKMRKMTDEQLVYYVENRVEKARSEGFNQGKRKNSKYKPINIEEIMKEISKVRGIGVTKLTDIQGIFEKYLRDFDISAQGGVIDGRP